LSSTQKGVTFIFEELGKTLADFNNSWQTTSIKILDANDCSFGRLTLMLLLHYLVKCRSRSLAVDNVNIHTG